jgi:hypothetical protein
MVSKRAWMDCAYDVPRGKKMKLVILICLGMLASCQESFDYDEDDSTISGTVTSVWSNLIISSAHAQSAADNLTSESEYLLAKDFIAGASDSDYGTVVTNTLANINVFLADVSPLVSSNASQFSDTDFPNGMGVSLGYNSQKKIVSVLLSPVAANGSYLFKDADSKKVSFYKMAFVLNTISGIQYRQSYVFRSGKRISDTVNYATSAASIKISEELANDSTLALSSLKTKLGLYKVNMNAFLPQSDEDDALALYLGSYYGDYSVLDPIQKTILDSTMLHALRANPVLKTAMLDLRDEFRDHLAVARPGSLFNFSSMFVAEGSGLIYDSVESVVDQLISAGAIPGGIAPI